MELALRALLGDLRYEIAAGRWILSMHFNSKQVAAPLHWQELEDLCLDLFRRVWSDPTAQKNGRDGQSQSGTDIWGTPNYAGGQFHGVQCKGKNSALGSALTEAELRSEVEKAKTFEPRLSHWILATTAAKDARIERVAREISEDHRNRGLFEVRVLGWEDIQSLISDYPAIIEKYYPDQAPRTRRILERLESSATAGHDLNSITTALRTAGAADLKKIKRTLVSIDPIQLDLEIEIDNQRRPIPTREICDLLGNGQSIVLQAEPGAGKTTTLLQLAEELLSTSSTAIPIVLILPILASSHRRVIDEIRSRASFHPFDEAAFSTAAEAGRVVLLCDGWNELSGEQRKWTMEELHSLRLNFPDVALIVTTRTNSTLPIGSSARLRLSPLTRDKQLAILVTQLGQQTAEELLVRARRVPGLRDVLQYPLYVSAIAAVGQVGSLPETKEQVLQSFVERHERVPRHKQRLDDLLKGTHRNYLRLLAARMTDGALAAVDDRAAREVLSDVARTLEQEKQIQTPPDPSDVLDALLSHHLLVDHGDSEKLIAFQHQQFQEWFASFVVEQRLFAAVSHQSDKTRAEFDRVLDRNTWEESLLFAVERVSRANPKGTQAVAYAILRALGIDPILAAQMIERASEAIWSIVAAPVQEFAAAWHGSDENDRALAFMVATGRPEFAEYIWHVLEDKESFNHAIFTHNRIRPTVFGSEWRKRWPNLPQETRRILMWDIAASGQDGIDFVIEAAKHETSPEVALAAVQSLEFRGNRSDVNKILRHAIHGLWPLLARILPLSRADQEFRTRLTLEKKLLVESSAPSTARIELMTELHESEGYGSPEDLIRDACELDYKSDYHLQTRVFEDLARRFPETLRRVVEHRILSGLPVPSPATDLSMSSANADQEQLRHIATDPSKRHSARTMSAARLLDRASAAKVIGEIFESESRLQVADAGAKKELWEQHNALTDALSVTEISALVEAILATLADHPRQISSLANLLFRWRGVAGHAGPLPLTEDLAQRLGERVKEWVVKLVSHPDAQRNQLSDLASAIKVLARPDLVSSLRSLLDADLVMWRTERAAAARAYKPHRMDGVRVSFLSIYRQAFEAINDNVTRDTLLAYVRDPDFDEDAAFALRAYAVTDALDLHVEGLGRPKYDKIFAARLKRSAGIVRPISAIANAVLDRIEELLSRGDDASVSTAVGISIAAAQMDYGDRVTTLLRALTAPGRISPRYGLLRCLLFAGETIRAETAVRGFDEVIAGLSTSRVHEDNWWLVRQWLELLIFSDRPQTTIDALKRLPPHLRSARQARDLIYPMAFIGESGAIPLLDAIAQVFPEIRSKHDWFSAFGSIGSLDAARYVLQRIFDPEVSSTLTHDAYYVVQTLSALLRSHALVRREAIERLKEPHTNPSRSLLASALGESIDSDDIMSLLDLVRADPNDPLRAALLTAAKNQALRRQPVEGTSAVYEIEPADIRELRQRLFQAVRSEGPRSKLASNLLSEIESCRQEYGRPPAEPRHPDLTTGRPWPAEADVAWSFAGSLTKASNGEQPVEADGSAVFQPKSIYEAIQLRPTFFGVGIDLKPFLDRLLARLFGSRR